MNFTKTEKLFWAQAYCDHFDKSTEFMIEFMQDVSDSSFDEVMDFLQFTPDHKREDWYNCNTDWLSYNIQNL